MKLDIAKEVATLEHMTVGQLQDRFAEVFGERPRSRHKQYLIRRIAWRMQASAEGGLSERALRRAEELADDADVRVTPPRSIGTTGADAATGGKVRAKVRHDRRLPPPGGAITRQYKGRTITVTVLDHGFEHDGERYRSLTAVAKAISGSHCNGFRFFGLLEDEK